MTQSCRFVEGVRGTCRFPRGDAPMRSSDGSAEGAPWGKPGFPHGPEPEAEAEAA